MKRFYFISVLALLLSPSTRAQVADGQVQLKDLSVEKIDTVVEVTFEAQVAKKTAKANQVLVFAPVLTNGEYQVSMPFVAVLGSGARTNLSRHQLASAGEPDFGNTIYAKNGKSVSYKATIPYQHWMKEARLEMESIRLGCCSSQTYPPLILKDSLFVTPVPEEAIVIEEPQAEIPEEPEIQMTIADTLARTFNFVVPADEFDPENPVIYDEDREGAIIIYFATGSSAIDPDYEENHQTLTNLTTSVRMIQESQSSNVSNVVVAGFSSPDGSFQYNDRLAFERAVSVKEYIMKETAIPDASILVFNGSVDWRGLRAFVLHTNLADKEEIVRIIDTVPIWDAKTNTGRLGTIMRLNGGKSYHYLRKEVFPKLRNGAFIKVYYENNHAN